MRHVKRIEFLSKYAKEGVHYDMAKEYEHAMNSAEGDHAYDVILHVKNNESATQPTIYNAIKKYESFGVDRYPSMKEGLIDKLDMENRKKLFHETTDDKTRMHLLNTTNHPDIFNTAIDYVENNPDKSDEIQGKLAFSKNTNEDHQLRMMKSPFFDDVKPLIGMKTKHKSVYDLAMNNSNEETRQATTLNRNFK